MEQRISTTTASRLLRVSKSTIQRQIKAGNLKAEMQKVSQGGGNCGMSNMIPVSEVLQQLDTQGRLLWYESQSGLSTQVSAADLATYKEAFGEEGLTELANRQQAVMALDGILNSGERGRTAAMDALAGTLGVTSRTLRRWHAAYKERGLAAIMDKVERRDKGQSRTCCQLARDFIEAQMCDNRKFPQTLVLERLRERAAEYGENACNCCVYCDGSDARQALKMADREKYPICTMASGSMMIPANRHAVNRIVETMDSTDDLRPLRQAGLGSCLHAENQAKQADDDQRSLVRRPPQDRPVCAGRERQSGAPVDDGLDGRLFQEIRRLGADT